MTLNPETHAALVEAQNLLRAINLVMGEDGTLRKKIEARMHEHLESLVESNDEQVRGRIKELMYVLEWPKMLEDEIGLLTSQLPAQDWL